MLSVVGLSIVYLIFRQRDYLNKKISRLAAWAFPLCAFVCIFLSKIYTGNVIEVIINKLLQGRVSNSHYFMEKYGDSLFGRNFTSSNKSLILDNSYVILWLKFGILFTVIGAFIVNGLIGGITGFGSLYSTYYINMSIFLAFAVMYPDMQVMLYFIIPIKMKWMAIVYAILTLYEFIVSGWAGRVAIFMSLLNFIIFFFSTRNFKRYSPHEIHRRQQFKSQMRQPRPGSGITKHKCAICGRTELDDPNLEFRFCSKCDGNYEYCQDHLFTHKHIKKG